MSKSELITKPVIERASKNNSHNVLLVSLSNCIACKKTEQFLRATNIEFEKIDVDLCDKKERKEILKDIRSRGGNRSINQIAFPKIIIDDKNMITGFDKEKIRKMLISEDAS